MSSTNSGSEGGGTSQWAAWIAAVVGLWVLVTPFFLGGGGGGGATNWLFWSNVVSGIVIAVLAGYAGVGTGGSSGSTGRAQTS